MFLRRLIVSQRRHVFCAGVVLSASRFCSGCGTTSSRADSPPTSAVNVESFTLNEEVVKRDMEALAKWNDLSSRMDAYREEKQYGKILSAVDEGIAMLEEMGALSAPIQCETLLLLEASQAHYNLQQYDLALERAKKAKQTLMAAPEGMRDAAKLGETNQLIGYIHLKSGKLEEANSVFTDILRWIDVDARTATPMQAVAAVNMRRFIVTGIALCWHKVAERECATGGDGREMYGKALDLLLEALNTHIDENDHEMVKMSLLSILQCFDGVGDGSQAVITAEKLVRWCSRHKDEQGIAEGNEWLTKMQEKYPQKKEEGDKV
ncbi:uncharacterized protein TEOVI_000557700 [Trypanosoma equiperdum]|uniref:Uncharacterized protein n=2 Tax=Trypanozoon TaxID=39700 RepID=Q584F1_TRYB2|nr:hypothetical protein, conserved [Trypanosoma brucei brucei TREU927]AAX79054.1 hypothetical protein, conserved [Trypanosoma brucei]AAZ10827.1 hypothetical protein, conserved [Trypanosoma brucei brucei TREU927]SCU66183.1 hypothetical protein, conserved [Trypanosoma equiperdum]